MGVSPFSSVYHVMYHRQFVGQGSQVAEAGPDREEVADQRDDGDHVDSKQTTQSREVAGPQMLVLRAGGWGKARSISFGSARHGKSTGLNAR